MSVIALLSLAAPAGSLARAPDYATANSATECFSYAYACTPGYDATNAQGTWAWTHYGPWSLNANGYHNCTLYAAWKLYKNGMGDLGNWGNAVEWINHTSSNHTPAVGSIAWWGSEVAGGYGHVAYVEQVRGGEVFIRADNYIGENADGYTDAGWIAASSVDAFLHPHDLPGGGGGGEPPPAPVLTTANLLTDGGFERGGEGWGTMGPAGAVLNHTSYAGSSAHDGTRYEEANSSVAGGSLYQDAAVNLRKGQSATFSMWVRLVGSGSPGQVANLCLWALSGGNVSACQSRELSTQWQQLEATTTMPAQTSGLRAQVYIPAGVNVDFDGGVLSPDLLVDGGFEGGGEGWGTMGPAGAVLNHTSYAGSSAHDGLRYEEANSSIAGGSLYQDAAVNLQLGQSATFSMWVRLAGSESPGEVANLCLWALSGGNVNACQAKELTTQWQQLQATATMPAQTSSLRAQVYIPAGVNVDFDGGSLSPNLLTDGGFERGGEGWGTMGPAGAVLNHTSYAGSSAHDGTRYEEANSSLSGGSLYQDVGVNMQEGQSATFSMWVRLAGSGASGQVANLCLWALSGGNVNACQARELTTQWQQLQATTTMPALTSTLRAQVYIPAGVNVDFDGGSLGAPQTAEPVYPSSSPDAGAAAAPAPTGPGDDAHIATARHPASAGACVVPLLKHKTLIAAKRALRHANCRLGVVRRRNGHRGAHRVSGQSARAKSDHHRGYRVGLTLG